MVKKLQKLAEQSAERKADRKADIKAMLPAGLLDSQLAQTIKDSAQQIWLAGLGAFAKAQGGGGKVFDTLMKEGAHLHRKSQSVAEEKLGDMAGRMSAMAGEVGSKANAQWDKLESIFEERTARALTRLGVPTARDIAALSAKVDALAAAVAALAPAAAASAAAGKAQGIAKFKAGKALRDSATIAPASPARKARAKAAETAPADLAPAPRQPARKKAAVAALVPEPAAAPARKRSRRQPASGA